MALYGGKENSPGKHAARNFVYTLGDKNVCRFNTGAHIVISSRECGDIHYLRERGVKKSNIIACDLDRLARQAAWRLGVRVSPYPDIVDTTKWSIDLRGKDNIASVNVDLCSPAVGGAPIVTKVLNLVGPKVPVYYTFVRGRDRGFYSTEDRIRELCSVFELNIKPEHYFCYQSSTDDSRGAPMCALVL